METKWILKLVDQITAPLRAIQGHADGAAEAVNTVAEQAGAASSSVSSITKPLKSATTAAEGLDDAFVETRSSAERLKKNIEAIKASIDKYKGKLAVETEPEKIRAYTTLIEEYGKKLKELEGLPDPEKAKKNWGAIALAANQTWEIAEKLIGSLDFAGEISNLQTSIQLLTDATGDDLDRLTQKTYRLGKVFNQDAEEIARAANAWSKQVGGTYEEALNQIQEGLKKGANLNGDFLDQLKEYGPQLKAAGITGAQGIAIMAKAGKDGVFSDKAIDAIKEANLSLREMGQPQLDALHAIGLKVKDLAGKSTFEAVQMISKAMEAAPIQAKQMALTDIFKGAGEDAGLSFIEGLGSVDMDINNIPSVEVAGESVKGFLADMQSWFATSFSGIAANVGTLGSIGAMISGFLPILSAIRTTTIGVAIANKLAAAGQWLLNTAMAANPFGIVAVALAAVAAGVMYAWNHFEGFREVVVGLWEVFKTVFNNIAGLFKAVFEPIGKAIAAIKEGRYMDAAKAALELSPVGMVVNATKYIAEGGLTKGVGEAWQKGKEAGKASFAADQAKDKPATAPQSPYTDGLDKNKPTKVTLDGKLFDPKSGKMGNASGLEINGSAGSGKGLTMNLSITNHFSQVSSKLDIRKAADEIAGIMVDRLRDAAVTMG